MPPNIEKSNPYHVGYEATARLSDMLRRYNPEDESLPPVFGTMKQGKFRAVRVLWEDFEQSLRNFPELIALAEKTNVMSRFAGLAERVEPIKPVEKSKKKTFKSYAI